MLRERIVLAACLLVCAASFFAGITWGLPSRNVDGFLFGDREPWTGKQIMQFIGDRGNALGADVDRDPLTRSGEPVLLNGTDEQRAQIVLRYRLYSYQPDEMITFMSLAGMRPRQLQLDPKLYQYGGLWIYPVGGLIGAALQPKSDVTFYLDNPEQFGKFYIVARAYSALWGLLGAVAIWWIVKRLTASIAACAFAVMCYGFLPVVVNMAHEAKPHLPAACLQLLAVVAGANFVATGKKLSWIVAGALCGAAVGMILSAWPIFAVLPVMVWLRSRALRATEPQGRSAWGRLIVIMLAGTTIGVDVYVATNPYVIKHLIAWNQPQNPLRSNIANSQAMYRADLSLTSVADAARLLGYAATPIVAIVGFLGAVWLVRQRELPLLVLLEGGRGEGIAATTQHHIIAAHALQWLLIAPAALILFQFTLLAAGKPGEFARFALFPAVALLIGAVCCIHRGLCSARGGVRAVAVIVGLAGVSHLMLAGISYGWHFVNDSQSRTTRIKIAERLEKLPAWSDRTLIVNAEPAPYALPPVDLFETRIHLAAADHRLAPGDLRIQTVDATNDSNLRTEVTAADGTPIHAYWMRPRLLWTPISWAGKTFKLESAPDTAGEQTNE